jgi:hypothetical protein
VTTIVKEMKVIAPVGVGLFLLAHKRHSGKYFQVILK